MDFNGKSILITGGTGSFGKKIHQNRFSAESRCEQNRHLFP